ncbi:MAG: nucleoside phosphorylase [Lachnospiraceae bacterium]|nr:nucleoside phosphorylase [Lachnospiraceae bacterium]
MIEYSEKQKGVSLMLLEQFDSCKQAVINPTDTTEKIDGIPKVAITCFAKETFYRLLDELNSEKIAEISMANMKLPVYRADYKGKEFVLYLSDVGAPACVGVLEDVYAMGVEKVIMFGTCGVLDSSIEDCSVIIPNAAMRDEGTSFHYMPAGDEILVNPRYTDDFQEILRRYSCRYTVGKVWTTDGFYRETREKVRIRKSQGCICVDMECSAAAAAAQFREKELFQFFYAADNLDHEKWDRRSLSNGDNLVQKDRVAALAMELALKIS